MISTEPWFTQKSAALEQDFREALRLQDWARVQALLQRMGVDLEDYACTKAERDAPSYYEQPLLMPRFEHSPEGVTLSVSSQIDLRWNRSSVESEATEIKWPPPGINPSYVWVKGFTDLQLAVIVGETLIEQSGGRLDAEGVADNFHPNPPETAVEWQRLMAKSIGTGWGKQGPSGYVGSPGMVRTIKFKSASAISPAQDGFESDYDVWYAKEWRVDVRIYWSEKVAWKELLQ